MQEGLIHVWLRRSRGLGVDEEFIKFRMLDWIRFIKRLERRDGVPYEIMVIDDVHGE